MTELLVKRGMGNQDYPMLLPKLEREESGVTLYTGTKDSPQEVSAKSVKKWLSY